MSAGSARRARARRRMVVCTGAFCAAALAGPLHLPAQERDGTARAAGSALGAAAFLTGCWEAVSADGSRITEEQWMAPRGGLMFGMSRAVRGETARGWELLTIRLEEGVLVYHAAPSGQAPTDFPARAVEAGRLEFVNAGHDFPRKIVYTRVEPERIDAAVFAEVDAAEPSFVLPYRRAACPGA